MKPSLSPWGHPQATALAAVPTIPPRGLHRGSSSLPTPRPPALPIPLESLRLPQTNRAAWSPPRPSPVGQGTADTSSSRCCSTIPPGEQLQRWMEGLSSSAVSSSGSHPSAGTCLLENCPPWRNPAGARCGVHPTALLLLAPGAGSPDLAHTRQGSCQAHRLGHPGQELLPPIPEDGPIQTSRL